jgi:hypothetical protein
MKDAILQIDGRLLAGVKWCFAPDFGELAKSHPRLTHDNKKYEVLEFVCQIK